ncbi:MAG: GNAT family N-acetyltransferase [Oscillospiraceae bacterium]|nr:GNAT family N-acetyltransferase [Oscillospiraceae bacterium]
MSEDLIFRKADIGDLYQIEGIYSRNLDEEEAGRISTGWTRNVYPTEETAKEAIDAGEMFVLEEKGRIVTCGRINKEQEDAYYVTDWRYPAPDEKIMVLHTFMTDPPYTGRGYGLRFVRCYEDYALKNGCPYLRMDTNELNARARAFYKKLGYEERGIVPCVFNGIREIRLVMLEKKLKENV